MAKETLCLFEERIHAVPLCRKSRYDKKIHIRHGSSAVNFVTECTCDTWVTAVLSERHHCGTAALGSVSLTAMTRRVLVICALNVLCR